jgi:hypothetical protein
MKSVSFTLSPRSAGLSRRIPSLTGTSHDTFRVQGDDKKEMSSVRYGVYKIDSHFF